MNIYSVYEQKGEDSKIDQKRIKLADIEMVENLGGDAGK